MIKYELPNLASLTEEQLHALAKSIVSGEHNPEQVKPITPEMIREALERHLKHPVVKPLRVLGRQEVDMVGGYPFKVPHRC